MKISLFDSIFSIPEACAIGPKLNGQPFLAHMMIRRCLDRERAPVPRPAIEMGMSARDNRIQPTKFDFALTA